MGKRKDFVAEQETSIEEMYRKVSLVEFEDLAAGNCNTIAEVYEKLVKPNELPKEIVLGWWEVLKEYVKDESCTFFIRKFEHKARRGFYTRGSDGVGFTYCGNPFAEYFYTMARAGFNPKGKYDSFRNFLNAASPFHIGHGNREEKNKGENPLHQAYKLGPRTKMSSRGWYLAHIHSVADAGSFEPGQEQVAARLFTCGNLDEWCMHSDFPCPYRDLGRTLSDDERRVLVARFLRFVNPMNYFLVPKNRGGKGNKKLQRLFIDGQEYKRGIGESELMIEFMRDIQRKRFGSEFDDFEKLGLCLPSNQNPVGGERISLQYSR